MLRPEVVEVAAIQRGHRSRPDSLGDRNDRRVRTAEPPVRVSADEFGHPAKIGIHQIHESVGIVSTRADVVEKCRFGLRPELSVVLIVPIGERHENVRVDDDHVGLPAEAVREDVVNLLGQVAASAGAVPQ